MKVSGSSKFLVREAKEGGAGGWKVSLKVNTGKAATAELLRSSWVSKGHIFPGGRSGMDTVESWARWTGTRCPP